MNSGVLPNQYMTSQNLTQIPQQYQFQQMSISNPSVMSTSRVDRFWQDIAFELTDGKSGSERHHELPMARIKKIMKMDDSVQQCMIGSEAPVIVAKACEIFIRELTIRAWEHTEESKRRTLQKVDITNAVSKNEMYDFLIDIIPREEQNADASADSNRVMGLNQMVFFYPSNNPTPMVDNPMPQVPNQLSSYMHSNQSAYPQPIPQPIPQVLTQQPHSYPQHVPQNGTNYVYVNDMQQVQPVQSSSMMNAPMMGMYGYSEN